jgi:hypothetical protein
MTKRICYIHIGPHKTGTTAIQSFLQGNRAELLRHSYFVPESGNVNGGHHPLARQLCGAEVPSQHRHAVAKFVEALAGASCEKIVISSEVLEALLRKKKYAHTFFNRIRDLNLEPKLVVFPRNQPQLMNSRYVEVVKGFQRSEPFEIFVSGEVHQAVFGYSDFIALATEFHAQLIARPFTGRLIAKSVVADFLQAIGLDPSRLPNTDTRRNQAAGPFTVSVARDVLRSIADSGRGLTEVQARRCKRKLTSYLREKGWADAGYCGLNNALAQEIGEIWRQDNDLFARQVWQKSWQEVFAKDEGVEFTPNDFDIVRPDERTKKQRHQAAREIMASIEDIIANRGDSNHVTGGFKRGGG